MLGNARTPYVAVSAADEGEEQREPADDAREAEDEEEVANDAAGDGGFDDLGVMGAERRDRQTGGVVDVERQGR